jgi:hypothetical protein
MIMLDEVEGNEQVGQSFNASVYLRGILFESRDDYPDCGFPQSLRANDGIIFKSRRNSFLPHSFQSLLSSRSTLYSLELLTASRNKLQSTLRPRRANERLTNIYVYERHKNYLFSFLFPFVCGCVMCSLILSRSMDVTIDGVWIGEWIY